jgi:hypothetical protein
MGKNITEDELLDELCGYILGDLEDIQPGDMPFYEVCRRTNVHMDTLKRRTAKGIIPAGYEVVDRRGHNGQTIKCYRKV